MGKRSRALDRAEWGIFAMQRMSVRFPQTVFCTFCFENDLRRLRCRINYFVVFSLCITFFFLLKWRTLDGLKTNGMKSCHENSCVFSRANNFYKLCESAWSVWVGAIAGNPTLAHSMWPLYTGDTIIFVWDITTEWHCRRNEPCTMKGLTWVAMSASAIHTNPICLL